MMILDAEGFGALAGEIFAEISAGRIVEDENVAPFEGDEEEIAEQRVPILAEEQLREAIAMLRLRLIEPARRIAEAERIAGEFGGEGAVRIAFVDEEGVAGDAKAARAEPGDDRIAKELEHLLGRILDQPAGFVD